mmetsp:Transcript_17296/g.56606  ORF Transcript_17296/g.56606 Transcript_17296/m.56606 type:complete len:265 (-) Transcript_17296:985-1779(-)|eukprot:CAMPEP_0170144026 /NCGR_PEP_ID=MMETSP0033_2-20121228/13263_1 /TAXON_ID=195969 /ORGANISM="Dolichomastix tenuilepis, Strain CCMP3274" /LENGTH=264 /DNA_ID=CAMNT_0010380503 /DNA_START=52 /DNA_END=846 /DNA_ORIENTATION=-
MSLSGVSSTFERFKAAVASGDTASAAGLLNQLKVAMTELKALPPFFEQTPTAQQELLLAREVLEHAVLLSVSQRDEAGFDRNFAQVKTYYTDTRHLIPASQQEFPILGLNLLRLLCANCIAEFHTELELLPMDVQKNVYIKHAIDLEQYLMEGSYHKVMAARSNVPAESYRYFMDLLAETVRAEIASCCEKAYVKLSLPDAAKILMMGSAAEVASFAAESGWVVSDGHIVFQDEVEPELGAKDINSAGLITSCLTYAKELERIV